MHDMLRFLYSLHARSQYQIKYYLLLLTIKISQTSQNVSRPQLKPQPMAYLINDLDSS